MCVCCIQLKETTSLEEGLSCLDCVMGVKPQQEKHQKSVADGLTLFRWLPPADNY